MRPYSIRLWGVSFCVSFCVLFCVSFCVLLFSVGNRPFSHDLNRKILSPSGFSWQNCTKILLAKEERLVYSGIRLQPTSLDELIRHTGYPVQKVLSILVSLELKGCIREVRKNDYVRTDLRITNGKISGDS